MYSRSTINAYSLISHEWWVPLIKFMVRPTIHVRGGLRIYGTPRVRNNFPNFYTKFSLHMAYAIPNVNAYSIKL